MTTIVTRAGKGSPLTNVEVDANFTNLNNDKLEKTGGTITANSTDPALKVTQTGAGNALDVTGNITVTGALSATSAAYGNTATLAGSAGGSGPYLQTSGAATDFSIYTGATKVSTFSPTGLTVTGELSATNAISTDSQVTISKDGSDTIGVGSFLQIRNTAATRSWATQLSASNNLDWWHLNGSWSKKMTLTSTGLSVTGALSASGALTTYGLKEDTSGNLGLGVTPSAWGGAISSAIEGRNGSAIAFGYSALRTVYFLSNAYFNGSNWIYKTTGATAQYELNADSGAHKWYTAPSGTAGNAISFTQAMTLDASGNLGLGVVPSAWGTVAALQIKNAAFIGFGETAYVSGNAYFNGGWKYIASSGAGRYDVDGGSGGVHRWYTAPSGTAGNAISFTQAMTLSASGGLSVGVTADAGTGNILIDAAKKICGNAPSGATSSTIELYNNLTGNMNLTAAYSSAAITFATGGTTERARIDSSGNLLVGTTSFGQPDVNAAAIGPADGAFRSHHATGTSSGTIHAYFTYGGLGIGSITQNGTTAVAYNTTSDHRLKENVRPADAARFMDIEFVDFEWVDGRHDCGVIAHQLQSVYPDLVLGEKDATETRQVEIEPAIPAVTEQQLVTEAVLDEEGNEVTPAVYETVEITPAVEAVTEDQTFPVYQQVNYIGLIGRMGTVIQKQQRIIEAMEARLSALEAA